MYERQTEQLRDPSEKSVKRINIGVDARVVKGGGL